MSVVEKKFLTPQQLSERWEGRISARTLANWRSSHTGPKYVGLTCHSNIQQASTATSPPLAHQLE